MQDAMMAVRVLKAKALLRVLADATIMVNGEELRVHVEALVTDIGKVLDDLGSKTRLTLRP